MTPAAPLVAVADLVAVSGLATLPPDASADMREPVLRHLRTALEGADAVRIAAVREAASERGISIGLLDAVAPAPEPASWPDTPRPPAPPVPDALPVSVLPPAIRDHVASVAAATQTPPDLAALLALASISTAVRGRAAVRVDGREWRELVCIYAAVVLPPASRKSPVYALMTAPVTAWEEEERERIGPAYRRARDRVDVAAAVLAAAKKAAAREKGKRSEDELVNARVRLDEAEAAVPILPKLIGSDVTPEALGRVMADQGGVLALLGPEADSLGLADGRYSNSPRLDELLRAWSGEPITVDRIGREPVRIARAVLTVGVTVQPAALAALQHGKVHRGRGLWGRVLWCAPPHGLGTRRTGADVPALDPDAASRYDAVVRALLDADGDAGSERVLELSDDARKAVHAFEAEIEPQLAEGGRLGLMGDWAGKAVGQAVRLAALIAIAARAEAGRSLWGPIDLQEVEGGVQLARALTSHAALVLAEIGMDERTVTLQYVLRRAREIPRGSTLRDLHEATRGRPGLETMDALRPATQALADRGCLRLVEQDRSGPGRPPSPVVELHPVFFADPQTPPQNPQIPAAGGGSAGSAGVNPGVESDFREGSGGSAGFAGVSGGGEKNAAVGETRGEQETFGDTLASLPDEGPEEWEGVQ